MDKTVLRVTGQPWHWTIFPRGKKANFTLDFVAWGPFSQRTNLVGMTALSLLLPARPDLALSITKTLREYLESQWNYNKLGKKLEGSEE